MSISGANGALLDVYRYGTSESANRMPKTSAGETGFAERLQSTGEEAELSKTDAYQKYLQQKYGGVSVQNVGKDQRSMDSVGAGTAGTGNVIIASNILEQMANDPEKAAFYEEKIRHYFDTLPKLKAEMSAMGHEIHSSGIVIHPDGTVTHYVSGDLKPEVRAKIEARIKAETEEKRKRRQMYLEQSEKAAKERRQQLEITYKKQNMAEILAGRKAGTDIITFAGTPEAVSSAIAAYGVNAMTVQDMAE